MSRHDDATPLRHMLDHAREAAMRVTEPYQLVHSDIPWRKIADTRNRLIHGYDDVNFDLLWDTIQLDLPPLIDQLEQIIGKK